MIPTDPNNIEVKGLWYHHIPTRLSLPRSELTLEEVPSAIESITKTRISKTDYSTGSRCDRATILYRGQSREVHIDRNGFITIRKESRL